MSEVANHWCVLVPHLRLDRGVHDRASKVEDRPLELFGVGLPSGAGSCFVVRQCRRVRRTARLLVGSGLRHVELKQVARADAGTPRPSDDHVVARAGRASLGQPRTTRRGAGLTQGDRAGRSFLQRPVCAEREFYTTGLAATTAVCLGAWFGNPVSRTARRPTSSPPRPAPRNRPRVQRRGLACTCRR